LIAGLATVFAAAPARADAIDGHWCHTDGRRMEIIGQVIVTPAGSRMDGNYSRHYFSYVAPQTERMGGTTIEMTLVNEMTVQTRAGSAEPEMWNRCAPPVSLLPSGQGQVASIDRALREGTPDRNTRLMATNI
jgi:hypothetical protein